MNVLQVCHQVRQTSIDFLTVTGKLTVFDAPRAERAVVSLGELDGHSLRQRKSVQRNFRDMFCLALTDVDLVGVAVMLNICTRLAECLSV